MIRFALYPIRRMRSLEINHWNLWCLPFIWYLVFHWRFFYFFLFIYLQLAIVMDTRDVADSTWNCTSFLAVYRVAFAWIVDMQQLDDTVTIAKRAITVIHPNQLAIAKCANVSISREYWTSIPFIQNGNRGAFALKRFIIDFHRNKLPLIVFFFVRYSCCFLMHCVAVFRKR